jgi:hypothetical protein
MVLAILLIVYLALRGFLEGMIMTKHTDPMAGTVKEEGVRSHRWFKWYHRISQWCDIYAAIIGAVTVCIVMKINVFDFFLALLKGHNLNWWYISGGFVIGWGLLEMLYNYDRCGKFFQCHENFLGVWQIKGDMVYYIHSARLLIGIALFIGGVI